MKRTATSELNRDNWDDEDDKEESGTFKLANENVLKTRVIKTARRHLQSNSSPNASLFAGFSGFGSNSSSKGKDSFNFLSKINVPNTADGSVADAAKKSTIQFNAFSEKSAKQGSDVNSEAISKNVSQNTLDALSVDELYYFKLKCLNIQVVDWLLKHLNKNPYCDFTDVFSGYQVYLKSIRDERDRKNASPTTVAAEKKLPSILNELKSAEPNPAGSSLFQIASDVVTSNLKESKSIKTNSSFQIANSNITDNLKENDEKKSASSLFQISSSNVTSNLKGSEDNKSTSLPFQITNSNITSNSNADKITEGLFSKITGSTVANNLKGNDFSVNAANSSSNSNSKSGTSLTPAFTFSAVNSFKSPFANLNEKIEKSSNSETVEKSSNSETVEKSSSSAVDTVFPKTGTNLFDNIQPTFAKPNSSNQFFSGLFKFGGGITDKKEADGTSQSADDDKKAEDDEDSAETVEVKKSFVEEDAVYTKRCKVYFKKYSTYKAHGIGNLFLKLVGENKKCQLIVRSDDSLGNIKINCLLSSDMPIQKVGKNNVSLFCCPTREVPPCSVLLKVKTSDDADEVVEMFKKYCN